MWQLDDVGAYADALEALGELAGTLLPGLVVVLIESDVDGTARRRGKLRHWAGVNCVPMAQVVLRKPACHSTAMSNSPSTRITVEKLLTIFQANNPPLECGNMSSFTAVKLDGSDLPSL